jgi:hypothetical protein
VILGFLGFCGNLFDFFVEFRAVSFGFSGSFSQFDVISAGGADRKPLSRKARQGRKEDKKSGSPSKWQGAAEMVMKKVVIILNSSITRANRESTVLKMDVVDNNRKQDSVVA